MERAEFEHFAIPRKEKEMKGKVYANVAKVEEVGLHKRARLHDQLDLHDHSGVSTKARTTMRHTWPE